MLAADEQLRDRDDAALLIGDRLDRGAQLLRDDAGRAKKLSVTLRPLRSSLSICAWLEPPKATPGSRMINIGRTKRKKMFIRQRSSRRRSVAAIASTFIVRSASPRA